MIELLQGRFSKGVMARICLEKTGLFPSPAEIAFKCSCPDWASMCKHVAAVLYGIGARLDAHPICCSRCARLTIRISLPRLPRACHRAGRNRRLERFSIREICHNAESRIMPSWSCPPMISPQKLQIHT